MKILPELTWMYTGYVNVYILWRERPWNRAIERMWLARLLWCCFFELQTLSRYVDCNHFTNSHHIFKSSCTSNNLVLLPLLLTASFSNSSAIMVQPSECSGMQSPKDAIKFYGFMERKTMYVHVIVTWPMVHCMLVVWLSRNLLQVTEVGTMNIFIHWINEDGGTTNDSKFIETVFAE